MYTPKIESYFTGGGLMDIGLHMSGVDVVASYEIDKECCEVYTHNFKRKVNPVDVSKKLVASSLDSDVMVFTYPCTKYSAIADIHGARTGDELYLHALRHMAIKQPEVYVLENVPGMRKFPLVMEAMTKMPNYYVNVFCPVKTETWLPQKRDRLIIFGSKKPFNWSAPEIPNRRASLSDIIEKDPCVEMTKSIFNRMSGKYRDLPIISDPSKGDIAPTAVAHYYKDRSTRLLKDDRFPLGVRPYSVREYARLQGVPDWFEFNCSENSAFRMIGNGVSVPVGNWVGGQLLKYFN